MVDEEVFHLVRDLGEKNGTQDAAEELVLYIRKSGEMCKEDYEKTSRDLRYSSGKIEKVIFKLLAKVVNKQNKNGNAQKASRIMFLLGYRSYLERSNRFRQKMENLLKAERMKQKKDFEKKQKKDTDKKPSEKSNRRRKSKLSIQSTTDSEFYTEARDDTVSPVESPVLTPNTTIQPTISSITINMPLPASEPGENSATGLNSTADTDMESMGEREPSPIPLVQNSNSISPLFPASVNAAVSISPSEMFNRRQESVTIGSGNSIAALGFSGTLYDDMYMKQEDCFNDARSTFWETGNDSMLYCMNGYYKQYDQDYDSLQFKSSQ